MSRILFLFLFCFGSFAYATYDESCLWTLSSRITVSELRAHLGDYFRAVEFDKREFVVTTARRQIDSATVMIRPFPSVSTLSITDSVTLTQLYRSLALIFARVQKGEVLLVLAPNQPVAVLTPYSNPKEYTY